MSIYTGRCIVCWHPKFSCTCAMGPCFHSGAEAVIAALCAGVEELESALRGGKALLDDAWTERRELEKKVQGLESALAGEKAASGFHEGVPAKAAQAQCLTGEQIAVLREAYEGLADSGYSMTAENLRGEFSAAFPGVFGKEDRNG